MARDPLIEFCDREGISHSNNGVLREFVYKGQYDAALTQIERDIEKQKKLIQSLKDLTIKIRRRQHLGHPDSIRHESVDRGRSGDTTRGQDNNSGPEEDSICEC